MRRRFAVGTALLCLAVGCDHQPTHTPFQHPPEQPEPSQLPVQLQEPPTQLAPPPAATPSPPEGFQPHPAPPEQPLHCGDERGNVGVPADLGTWDDAEPVEPLPPASIHAKGGTGRLPTAPRALKGVVTPWTSGRRLAVHGDALFIVDRDNGRLVVLDRLSGELLRSVAVGSGPDQVVVGPDGTAFVSVSRCGEVVQVASGGSAVSGSVAIGGGPSGLALTEDGARLLVSDTAGDAVVMLDAQDLAVLDRLEGVVTRPAGLAVTSRGSVVVTQRGSSVYEVPLQRNRFGTPKEHVLRRMTPTQRALSAYITTTTFQAANAAAAVVHPETRATLVLHEIARTGTIVDTFPGAPPILMPGGYYPPPDPTIVVEGHVRGEVSRPLTTAVTTIGGGGNSNESSSVPVVDPVTEESPLALIARPTDINHHPKLTLAFVTGKATDTVLVFNTDNVDAMDDPVATIRTGEAPVSVTFSEDGQLAYILNSHDFTISEVDLQPLFDEVPASGSRWMDAPLHLSHARVAAFGDDPLPKRYHYGRRLFTFARNAKVSRDGQLACASCHIDGLEDGLTWVVPEGPRQTPSLAGRLHDTAPYNWLGTKATLIDNMSRSISRMGGSGLEPVDLFDIQQFMLNGLLAPRNERTVSPRAFTKSQSRGQQLFNDPSVGCAGCHSGGALTDGGQHDVGTAHAGDMDARLDTPTLRGLRFSAPYLHDGSADTLFDVLEATSMTMGYTEHLTLQEKLDLIAYLETL